MVPVVACFNPKHSRGPDGLISSRWIHKYICCRLGESIDQWEGANTGDMLLVIYFMISSCKVLAAFHSSCFINLSSHIFCFLVSIRPFIYCIDQTIFTWKSRIVADASICVLVSVSPPHVLVVFCTSPATYWGLQQAKIAIAPPPAFTNFIIILSLLNHPAM